MFSRLPKLVIPFLLLACVVFAPGSLYAGKVRTRATQTEHNSFSTPNQYLSITTTSNDRLLVFLGEETEFSEEDEVHEDRKSKIADYNFVWGEHLLRLTQSLPTYHTCRHSVCHKQTPLFVVYGIFRI